MMGRHGGMICLNFNLLGMVDVFIIYYVFIPLNLAMLSCNLVQFYLVCRFSGSKSKEKQLEHEGLKEHSNPDSEQLVSTDQPTSPNH